MTQIDPGLSAALRHAAQRNGDHARLDGDPYAEVPPPTEEPAADDAGAVGEADITEALIQQRLDWLRITQEARRRLDEENQPQAEPPAVKSLTRLLSEPDEDAEHRIEGLAPAAGRVLLSAQWKSGKSITIGNLIRSLVDGDDFLDRFTVNITARSLVLIDDELGEAKLRRWLRNQGIANTDAVVDVVDLRGKAHTFNLLDDRVRAAWAQRFRDLGCDYLILDCLRPVLDALGLDESHDVGRFLVAFDALLAEAGVNDAALVQHMGHSNERARGDSRLQDWPDALWRIVRENEEPDSARYFSAYGRDVDVPEGRLEFDPQTRRLTYEDGSRKQKKAAEERSEALRCVVDVLAQHFLKPLTDDGGNVKAMTTNAVKKVVAAEHQIGNRRVDAALKDGADSGILKADSGTNRAVIYSIANPCLACGNPVTDPNASTHRECER